MSFSEMEFDNGGKEDFMTAYMTRAQQLAHRRDLVATFESGLAEVTPKLFEQEGRIIAGTLTDTTLPWWRDRDYSAALATIPGLSGYYVTREGLLVIRLKDENERLYYRFYRPKKLTVGELQDANRAFKPFLEQKK